MLIHQFLFFQNVWKKTRSGCLNKVLQNHLEFRWKSEEKKKNNCYTNFVRVCANVIRCPQNDFFNIINISAKAFFTKSFKNTLWFKAKSKNCREVFFCAPHCDHVYYKVNKSCQISRRGYSKSFFIG